jgi:hypothetical protein
MFVFFTGVHRQTSWLRMLLEALLAFRRPPLPAPFYISIGRARYKPPRSA